MLYEFVSQNLDYHVDPDFSNNIRDNVSLIKQTIPNLKNARNLIY